MTLGSAYPFDNPVPPAAPDARPQLVFTCSEDAPDGLIWDDAERVDAQGRRSDGEPDFDFVRFATHDAVRITGAMDFHVYDDRIHCHLIDERHRYLVEIALFGMVFALWFERRGTPTIHAAVTVRHGTALAFLASKGAGKTTLATACIAGGHQFLADDLLTLTPGAEGFRVARGVPALRLWPEQIERFVGGGDFPPVHPDYPKRRVDVPTAFGRFADGDAPLARLYLPERHDGARAVQLERLPAQAALMALVRHSFLPREVQRYGWQAERLHAFARLLATTPLVRLSYPSGYGRLADVVAAIEDDLASDAASGFR